MTILARKRIITRISWMSSGLTERLRYRLLRVRYRGYRSKARLGKWRQSIKSSSCCSLRCLSVMKKRSKSWPKSNIRKSFKWRSKGLCTSRKCSKRLKNRSSSWNSSCRLFKRKDLKSMVLSRSKKTQSMTSLTRNSKRNLMSSLATSHNGCKSRTWKFKTSSTANTKNFKMRFTLQMSSSTTVWLWMTSMISRPEPKPCNPSRLRNLKSKLKISKPGLNRNSWKHTTKWSRVR